MTATLQTYLTQTQRLLHDANYNFYTQTELTDYINEARNRLVRDTGCLRTIQTSSTVVSQETYPFSGLPQGNLTMDILNINLYWGNSRVPLRYLPWSQFNAQLRYWQNYIGRPICFSLYSPNIIYLGPVPDQIYTLELDTVIEPVTMVSTSDTDTIPDPWTSPVAFYAAHLAKYKEQSYGEADLFKNAYMSKVSNLLAGTMTRRIPDVYSQAY
jgi:hypothetical protein